MAKDTEMKDKAAAEAPAAATEAAPEAAPPTVADSLAANIKLIGKAVQAKETRAVFGKVLRQTAAVRKQLTAGELQAFVSSVLPADHPSAQTLLTALAQVGGDAPRGRAARGPGPAGRGPGPPCRTPETAGSSAPTPPNRAAQAGMDTDAGEDGKAAGEAAAAPAGEPLPEVEVYAYLVALMFLTDAKAWEEVSPAAGGGGAGAGLGSVHSCAGAAAGAAQRFRV